MSPRGYLTQCDAGATGYGMPVVRCSETTRLDKPGKWRCPSCVQRLGPLPEPKAAP